MDEKLTVEELMEFLEEFASGWPVEFQDDSGNAFAFKHIVNPLGGPVCRIVLKEV